MTVEEIKEKYTMRDILNKCSLPQPNRSGFICCPFHSENTASMKIYDRSYYCFGCGEGGDIISFYQKYNGLDFKGAFAELGGAYAKPKPIDLIRRKRKQNKKAVESAKMRRLKSELTSACDELSANRYIMQNTEPMSDLWCEAMENSQMLENKVDLIQTKIKEKEVIIRELQIS